MEGIKGHASAISFFGGRIPACEPSTSKLCNGNNNKTFCFALTAQISYINRFRKNDLHEYVFHFCQEVLSYGGKIVLFYTNKLLSNTVCIKLILQWIILNLQIVGMYRSGEYSVSALSGYKIRIIKKLIMYVLYYC